MPTCIRIITFLTVLLGYSTFLTAQPPVIIPKKQYHTKPLQNSLVFDGVLDDDAWNTVEWGGDFTQYLPDNGGRPFYPTQFKILYDDKFLYLGYRAFDPSPDSIVQRMSRRDEFPGDWVEVNIDSYHDKRTAFSFTFSVSGVRGDELVSNNGNGNWDTNWNPIWSGKAQIDSLGWTAEVKIPFSQLRYASGEDQVWGIQLMRRIFRQEERSTWQHIPLNAGGWVSEFGELHGLKNLPPQRQVEIAPYVVAQTERFEKTEDNPFADGSDNRLSAGVDGKVAVTSDLILDFTVNPDFGQVEADPGAVRLDGYQNFFEERRPFFMESRNLFDYQITSSATDGDFDGDLLFYSRRIGGAPHGSPSLQDGEYADVPANATILGAAKFSGKTKNGWSIGILESITEREKATVAFDTLRRKELVEPLTSYFVGRLMKDFDEGNTVIGGIFTAVNREKGLDWLPSSAYTGGLDVQHFWKNRWWTVKGNLLFSHLQGNEEAILNTQTAFERYFQRPNAPHVEVDSSRNSLTGAGGTLKIGKFGGSPDSLGGVFKFETGATWRSPEFELNDIGFLQTADEINHFTWAGYHLQKPFSIFRNARINYNHWSRWDFGGQHTWLAFNTSIHFWFKNQWRLGTGFTWNPLDLSNNALRGGSTLRKPPGMGQNFYVETDSRKRVSFFANGFFAWGFDHTVRVQNGGVGILLQPLDALSLSLRPGYNHSWRKQDQYVAQAGFGKETRTIVSEVNQRSFSLTARLNYNITPDLTVQYYGQPFIFRAEYKNFGYVTDPLNQEYDRRFRRFSESEIKDSEGVFYIDEDSDGSPDYNFDKPDFNYIQLRSNLVLRWEYVPGSEIYLVWSQNSTPDAFGDLDTPLVRSLFDHVFQEKGRSIFLVKFTYRFLL